MVRRAAGFIIFICLGLALATTELLADVHDPLDPLDFPWPSLEIDKNDENKTPDQLIYEAEFLLEDERFLDARTKLLKALEKDPKEYKAHLLLAGYYLVHVGHYRLALKYTKRAQVLIVEKHGKPPYEDLNTKTDHAHALYLLSQIRLNLDNYKGSLDVLDEYASYEYFQGWYPGSRAWVLMKLGDLNEAIRVARLGLLIGAETGRTLNMLGILLSMTGERQHSLNVFDEAVRYELSLGDKAGQPATPLNNAGEVYKEIFLEDRAETSWLKATSMPDGCEHVLPSLNLALLYIDQLQFADAVRTMDKFESCVAQYPLRSEEEHRALVHFALGRVDLHTGNVDSAIAHLEQALERKQWFGKIGTSQEDLEAGVMISLAQALRIKNNRMRFYLQPSVGSAAAEWKNRVWRSVRAWWLMRRARQVLLGLNNFEDLFVRRTDSMIEYPTFGEVLSGLPQRSLMRRIKSERDADNRAAAQPYYDAYMAEALLGGWQEDEGVKLLGRVRTSLRPQYDDLLRLHTKLLDLKTLDPYSEQYRRIAYETYGLSRAALINHGLKLPLSFAGGDSDVASAAAKAGFLIVNSSPPLACTIESAKKDGEYRLQFSCPYSHPSKMQVSGKEVPEVINKLMEKVFVVKVDGKM